MARFPFTLRELFLLVVIAAMGLAWWVDHSRLENTNRELEGRMYVVWP